MTAASALDLLHGERYLAVEVDLAPLSGPTIQPTTFANTGASFYVAPDGDLAAVIDSVASMANQMELAVWDEARQVPAAPVQALAWVRVDDDQGAYFTSSRRAAHRLNAHSLMTGQVDGESFEGRIDRMLAEPPPPPVRRLAEVVWDHDPLALVHGCWFAGIWDGRARLTRALSARIDAFGVESQAVQVGGQKSADHLSEVAVRQAGAEGKTVAGEVPVYMSEVSARRVVGTFLLDVDLVRSYGLGEVRERALVAAAVLMIGELISSWPRRRSRCVLTPTGVSVREPSGWAMPELTDLRDECAVRCREASGAERADPLVVTHASKKAKGAS